MHNNGLDKVLPRQSCPPPLARLLGWKDHSRLRGTLKPFLSRAQMEKLDTELKNRS